MVVQGQRQRAFVLDVSPRGLFVQTSKAIDPGAQISVKLQLRGHKEEVELLAEVARSRRISLR